MCERRILVHEGKVDIHARLGHSGDKRLERSRQRYDSGQYKIGCEADFDGEPSVASKFHAQTIVFIVGLGVFSVNVFDEVQNGSELMQVAQIDVSVGTLTVCKQFQQRLARSCSAWWLLSGRTGSHLPASRRHTMQRMLCATTYCKSRRMRWTRRISCPKSKWKRIEERKCHFDYLHGKCLGRLFWITF